ncbi:MAG TPA: RNA pseudouridine synthase [Chromatiaceae bacterium]|jgi:tRNA pseudouridine32 synthase/23S rRNA pseudouridine746 synthase|nr:RNA pseudouridine synthase [Chromatiaceae bacterium]HIB84810.1 RNA pseudouridine synthase [Chromatiaceae bacterium]HIN82893.1 RNA pseudouridine synthase [Chromatiales bacterium]HIO13968.1 RNA pseudouridine synthase [Chromatiales bacterium]
MTAQRIECHLSIPGPQPGVLEPLYAVSGLPKQRLKDAMDKGAVWLTRKDSTQRLRRKTRPLQAGDLIHLYYDESVLKQRAPEPELVADEGDYSIWDKPKGMYSQGSRWGDHCTITRWAEKHLQPQRNAFLVHRLDRAASGLIIIAHKKQTAAAFARLFRQRRIDKHYHARVHGEWSLQAEVLQLETMLDDKTAVTCVKALAYDAEHSQTQLDVAIATGRKHQIRRHLAEAGYPIVGDRLYGQNDDDHELALRAYHLAFDSPVDGRPMVYSVS